jgi:hypothetical protein
MKPRLRQDWEHHRRHQCPECCERRTRSPGRRPHIHMGSTCAANSGAYQDRTDPAWRTAHGRDDLRRLSCRPKRDCDSEARSRAVRTLGQSSWRDLISAPGDIDLRGILVDPFVRYLFFALVIMIAVRFCCRSPRIEINVRDPPFAEAAVYVCILASLIAFWI